MEGEKGWGNSPGSKVFARQVRRPEFNPPEQQQKASAGKMAASLTTWVEFLEIAVGGEYRMQQVDL